MKTKLAFSFTLGLSIIMLGALAQPAQAQTYSKTFVLKGKDGGKFRLRGYLKQSQGTKTKTVKVVAASSKSSKNSNKLTNKQVKKVH